MQEFKHQQKQDASGPWTPLLRQADIFGSRLKAILWILPPSLYQSIMGRIVLYMFCEDSCYPAVSRAVARGAQYPTSANRAGQPKMSIRIHRGKKVLSESALVCPHKLVQTCTAQVLRNDLKLKRGGLHTFGVP